MKPRPPRHPQRQVNWRECGNLQAVSQRRRPRPTSGPCACPAETAALKTIKRGQQRRRLSHVKAL